MQDKLKATFEQLKTLYESMSMRARWSSAAVLVAAVVGLLYLTTAEHHNYATLFSGLSSADASKIVEELKRNKVPYQLDSGGSVIRVPNEKVHETRLLMAGQGLPQGGGVGFEIFDKQEFGVSDFAQQVNYRRALQGELERTIAQVDGVRTARVHLALAKRQLFARESNPASAAVTLGLESGRTLARGQVKAIVHLVSSSVSALNPDHITLVDTYGTMLWDGTDDGLNGPGGIYEQRLKLEQKLEQRIGELLDRALGAGHAVVRVSADLTLTSEEHTEETYDPETAAVRSEVSSEEEERSNGTASGVAGVESNLAVATPPKTQGGEGSRRKEVTRNYELTKTIRRRLLPAGELRRLSVAVLVDEAALTAKQAADAGGKDKKGEAKPVIAIKISDLENVIKQAVGFTPKRGDVVTVRSVPFAPPQVIETPIEPKYMQMLRRFGPWALATLPALFFVVVWLLRRRASRRSSVKILNQTVRELEQRQSLLGEASDGASEEESAAGEQLQLEAPARQLALTAAESDANRSAQVIRAWLAEESA